MCKPIVVTLPFVLLLLDYWPLGRMTFGDAGGPNAVGDGNGVAAASTSLPRLVCEKIPLLALAAASCVATLWAQSDAISANDHLPFAALFGNAAVSYIEYVAKFFYPADLAVFYPFPPAGQSWWQVAVRSGCWRL